MTFENEPFDWQAALSDDLAHALAHGAECALTDAARDVDAMSPGEHALVGIGLAMLAVRAQVAQTGGEVADQLSAMADDVRDLTDAVVAIRQPWWRRLVNVTGRIHRPSAAALAAEASEEGHGGDVEVAATPDVATVTPLHKGVR